MARSEGTEGRQRRPLAAPSPGVRGSGGRGAGRGSPPEPGPCLGTLAKLPCCVCVLLPCARAVPPVGLGVCVSATGCAEALVDVPSFSEVEPFLEIGLW